MLGNRHPVRPACRRRHQRSRRGNIECPRVIPARPAGVAFSRITVAAPTISSMLGPRPWISESTAAVWAAVARPSMMHVNTSTA
jgi:hypothetical protein